MKHKQVPLYGICTGAHFLYWGNFSVLGNYEMSPVHFCGYTDSPGTFQRSIEEKIIEAEEEEEMQNLVGMLPSFLREVTYLHFYKNLSVQEIARLHNKPSQIIDTWLTHSIYWLKIFVRKFKPPE